MDGRRYDTNGSIAGGAASGVMTTRNSVGRKQPLTAALGQRIAQAPTFTAPAVAPTNQPKHNWAAQRSGGRQTASQNGRTRAALMRKRARAS